MGPLILTVAGAPGSSGDGSQPQRLSCYSPVPTCRLPPKETKGAGTAIPAPICRWNRWQPATMYYSTWVVPLQARFCRNWYQCAGAGSCQGRTRSRGPLAKPLTTASERAIRGARNPGSAAAAMRAAARGGRLGRMADRRPWRPGAKAARALMCARCRPGRGTPFFHLRSLTLFFSAKSAGFLRTAGSVFQSSHDTPLSHVCSRANTETS